MWTVPSLDLLVLSSTSCSRHLYSKHFGIFPTQRVVTKLCTESSVVKRTSRVRRGPRRPSAPSQSRMQPHAPMASVRPDCETPSSITCVSGENDVPSVTTTVVTFYAHSVTHTRLHNGSDTRHQPVPGARQMGPRLVGLDVAFFFRFGFFLFAESFFLHHITRVASGCRNASLLPVAGGAS